MMDGWMDSAISNDLERHSVI